LATVELARRQALLRDESAQLASRLVAAEIVAQALNAAAADMGRAAELLRGRQTGEPTATAQLAATARLKQLLAAATMSPGSDGAPTPTPQDRPPDQPPPGRSVAELNLLKLMQQEIARRTKQLHDQRPTARALSPDEAQQYDDLAAQQGQLAEQARQSLAPADSTNPPDAPNKPPSTPPTLDKMREVQSLIAARKVDEPTQRLEQSILADLDALVEQARRQQRTASTGNTGGGRQESNTGGADKRGADAGTGTVGDTTGNQGTGRTGQGEVRVVDPVLTRAMLRDAWGQLPPQVRDAMGQNPDVRFLPQYQADLEKYYRRLIDRKPRTDPEHSR
jgi:hypothetical protein